MSSLARLKLIIPPTRLPFAAACSTCWLGSVRFPAAYRPGTEVSPIASVSTKSPSPVGCGAGDQTERRERLDADPEWCADDDGVGVDALTVDSSSTAVT